MATTGTLAYGANDKPTELDAALIPLFANASQKTIWGDLPPTKSYRITKISDSEYNVEVTQIKSAGGVLTNFEDFHNFDVGYTRLYKINPIARTSSFVHATVEIRYENEMGFTVPYSQDEEYLRGISSSMFMPTIASVNAWIDSIK